MTAIDLIPYAGLVIGLVFGLSSQMTGFCLYRGLKECWSKQHGYKLQAFALALAVAVAGTHLISSTGLVDTHQSLYLNPSVSWLLVPLGGLMFGYGMGLANGCGARALVLLAQGNLRSLVVLGCLGIAAYMTLSGVLAPLRLYALQHTSLNLPASTLPETSLRSLIIWVFVAALTLYAVGRTNLRQRLVDLAGGAIIGLLISAGWLVTGWLGADPFEPMTPTSLSFVAPIGDTIQYAMLSTGVSLRFGTAIVIGVFIGSFLAALLRGRYQLEAFESAPQMSRYIAGGSLMGVGGVLAMGCSIGQGLTGLSTLAYASFIAVLSIVIGARLAWKAADAKA